MTPSSPPSYTFLDSPTSPLLTSLASHSTPPTVPQFDPNPPGLPGTTQLNIHPSNTPQPTTNLSTHQSSSPVHQSSNNTDPLPTAQTTSPNPVPTNTLSSAPIISPLPLSHTQPVN
ncbi:hypothetical protein Tco_0958297 [Tanacetum coccineum]